MHESNWLHSLPLSRNVKTATIIHTICQTSVIETETFKISKIHKITSVNQSNVHI